MTLFSYCSLESRISTHYVQNMTTPLLTCALPLYRSADIAWLALESLSHQQDAPPWELIVLEEEAEAYTEAGLNSHIDALSSAGCVAVRYYSTRKKMNLGEKWRRMASFAHGEMIVLVAGDCYSPPRRLRETYDVLCGFEWVQSPIGAFYDIGTGAFAVYDHALNKHGRHTALNMATHTHLLKLLPECDKVSGIDGWIYEHIWNELRRMPRTFINQSPSWASGLDTHGLNNISSGRGAMLGPGSSTPVAPFRPAVNDEPRTVDDVLPADICLRLRALQKCAAERAKVY